MRGRSGSGKRLWAHTLSCDFDVREGNQKWESDVAVIYVMLSLCLPNYWGGWLFISVRALY